MTNLERMKKGMLYITDDEVLQAQVPGRRLTQKMNTMDRSDYEGIKAVVKELLGQADDIWINPPFYCDYGHNIEVGKNTFINYNCTILDTGVVRIGENCQIAPNVSIYTAGHPIHPAVRNTLYEYGIDVTIGDNVVIGAGSVVTKDIPAWSFAAGNPCRVIRQITEEDRVYGIRNQKTDPAAWEHMKRIWQESDDPARYPENV